MYELVYILPPDYDETKCNQASQIIAKTISKRNGAIAKEESIGERLLKYPVKGLSRGLYYLVEFTIPVDHLENLKKDLNLNEEIVRYIITKKETVKEKEPDQSQKQEAKEKPQDKEPKVSKKQPEPKKKPAKKAYTIVKTEDEEKEKPKKTSLDDLDKKLNEILE